MYRAGYVGGPTMAVIAQKTLKLKLTLLILMQKELISGIQRFKKLPIFEPGLDKGMSETREKIYFSTEIEKY